MAKKASQSGKRSRERKIGDQAAGAFAVAGFLVMAVVPASNGVKLGVLAGFLICAFIARELVPAWVTKHERPSADETGVRIEPQLMVDTSQWNLYLLRTIEWHRFEQVCAKYFEALGLRAELTPFGADGGVDIHLFAPGSNTPGTLVQCKSWRTTKVGVADVRELYGVMAAENVGEGCFVTTGTFTNDAVAFADGKALRLLDGKAIIDSICGLSRETQSALLAIATTGDFVTPTCASCGIKMVKRERKSDKSDFWGCSNYPGCRNTISS